MITLQELFPFLEQYLSSSTFTDDCPNGLQVEGKKEIKKIALAVSPSLATIEEAVRSQADALIVHHGIFWNKDALSVRGPKKEKLKALLCNEISLLAYHLPVDAHQIVGNNWKAAHDLRWNALQPFGTYRHMSIGVKGRFSPIPIEEFKQQLEVYYGHPAHVALGGKKEVSSAGIISGGAHWNIEQAANEDLDCYITGSFDEPIWNIAHERKINFFALGHYATEKVGMLALTELLRRQFDVVTEFIDLPNPF